MNKDIFTNVFRILVTSLLFYIAILLDDVRKNSEFIMLSAKTDIKEVQDVRIVQSDSQAFDDAQKVQRVLIVNPAVPISGKVSIDTGVFGEGIPVNITNKGGPFGHPVPVKVSP